MRPARADRGAASLWLLAVGLVLLSAALVATMVGTAHVARHRAQAAADLGALAGAVRVIEGEQIACARAGQLVAANGARLVDCRLDGIDLTVRVQLTPAPALRLPGPATATARAGPIRANDSRLPGADVASAGLP